MKPLDILRQEIAAGEEAFDENGLHALIRDMEEGLKRVNTPKDLNRRISDWKEIFQTLFAASFVQPVAGLINVEIVHDFGRHLLDGPTSDEMYDLIHYYLEFLRQPELLVRINDTRPFETLILQLVQHGQFTVAALLQLRARLYGDKNWLGAIHGEEIVHYTFGHAYRRINQMARGLLALVGDHEKSKPVVAFLCENSPEMAMADLACLSSGLVNVMIPANSVSSQIAFILNQTQVKVLIVGGQKHLSRVNEVRRELRSLEHIVMINELPREKDVLSLDELLERGMDIGEEQLSYVRKQIRIDDLATIMYTSGTTGEPKGIMFSQLNLIYKRFCRALALPQIGPQDRFLAYLPLYHTFGRYLELMGSLFWSAEYYFMENPALETLVRSMRLVHPTVFISIPKKWQQLFDYITARTDIMTDDDGQILQTVKEATGGALRWGLSAAGYLDPAVFRFFQRYGIELLSGFGMTEATGGITMTLPGQYVENALGKPLPGIEAKLAEDGELLIRGPYVMKGYFAQGQEAFTKEGWFPTGDIMRRLPNGYFEIIDRKKEIYKNIRGETIAPQRIEKYFYDFDYVKQVYLVGDNRPFNTVLIYPNFDGAENPLRKMSQQELHDLFTSVVVTVNNFLAPFERIVDFRIMERPFSAEFGELTPKGTYKRKVIENNFAQTIETMYRRSFVEFRWHHFTIRLPNWFLREMGYLTQDIRITEHHLIIDKENLSLPLSLEAEHLVRIGRYRYAVKNTTIDLQVLFSNPIYWLGNQELVDFSKEQVFQWYRLDSPDENIRFAGNVSNIPVERTVIDELRQRIEKNDLNLQGLHEAVLLLQTNDSEVVDEATSYLMLFLKKSHHTFYHLVKEIAANPHFGTGIYSLRQQFHLGLIIFRGTAFKDFFNRYLQADSNLLNEELIREIAKSTANDPDVLKAVFSLIKERAAQKAEDDPLLPKLFDLLSQIGVEHPLYYKEIRQHLVRYQLRKECKQLARKAAQARRKLVSGFRKWIGENQQISIDVETGREYRWQDVVIFDGAIAEQDRKFLLHALSSRPIIRETLFLLADGVLVGLYDIPPGGVWISQLHQEADHAVYRVSVQTRFQGGFDFVINLERSKATRTLREEMNWLIHACAPTGGLKLVEEFGGFWKELNLWTEEYIAGDSLQRYFAKMMRRENAETRQRLHYLWPMFIWTGISAYVSFWRRTGYRFEVKDISPANIMIPPHDYLSGVRIFSIRKRKKSKGLSAIIFNFMEQFVKPLERTYPFIKHPNKWYFVLSGIIDALGVEKGQMYLRELLEWLEEQGKHAHLRDYLRRYLRDIATKGFTPKNLYFAVQRFRRWLELNPVADFSAQLFTLNELYETYGLSGLEAHYPGLRIRYFLDSIFHDSHSDIQSKLLEILHLVQKDKISHDDQLKLFAELRSQFKLTTREEFFLSRLSYPHLQPEASAGWMSSSSAGGTQQNDVVVTLEDYDGMHYHVRKPISPKEISRLHRIFLEANLPVVFKPEHRYLIAVSERGFVIGGLFYRILDEQTVHIEKIVVSEKYRRKGISEGLMTEFFSRMQDADFRFVTTGFFRPEYFYRFGFKIERKYAGLVKDLRPTS